MSKKNIDSEIIRSIEDGEWQSVSDMSRVKESLERAARSTIIKDQRMNIRISKRDLESLKTRALEEGMPYQTLVSSVLHKYITGRLVEK